MSKTASPGALCDVCKGLALEKIENREHAEYPLATPPQNQSYTECPFCTLMTKANGGRPPTTTKWNERGFTTNLGGTNLVFLNEATATSPHGGAREIQPQIDPALMKKWLELCETHHTESCTPIPVVKTEDNPAGLDILRVIDVQDQCIVEAVPGTRYVALSYVWGQVVPAVRLQKDNKASFAAKGGLLSVRLRFPHSINDAIDLVGVLGERYIWIDNLCLVQDDEEDMLRGISKMDLVYRGAILTIVAAQGTDANAGLPGLRPGSRKVKQDIVEVIPGVKMTITRGAYDALGSTSNGYTSRGWTMQELLLSHRTLMFADGGIWFRCHANCWGEDTIYDKFPSEVVPTQSLHSGSLIDVLPDKSDQPLHDYGNFLFRYTYRVLTKESDRIHAATGVLRHIFSQIDNSVALEGIPSRAFDIGLLSWDPFPLVESKGGRRPEFPSWSWAGWYAARVPLGYHRDECTYIENLRDWLRTNTYIIWYQRKPDSTTVEPVWDDELQRKFGDNVYGRDIDPALEGSNTVPSTSIPADFIERGYHFLHFWAYTVKFPNLRPPEPGHWAQVYTILGVGDVDCGGLRLDDQRLLKSIEKPYEVVLLSKCKRFNNLFNDNIVVEKPIYFVMLLEWLDPERVVAERRGMGYILQDSLEHMIGTGRAWKEIVLA